MNLRLQVTLAWRPPWSLLYLHGSSSSFDKIQRLPIQQYTKAWRKYGLFRLFQVRTMDGGRVLGRLVSWLCHKDVYHVLLFHFFCLSVSRLSHLWFYMVFQFMDLHYIQCLMHNQYSDELNSEVESLSSRFRRVKTNGRVDVIL